MHDGNKSSGSSIPFDDIDIAKVDVFGKKTQSDFWDEIAFVNHHMLFFKDRIGDILRWGGGNMADEEREIEHLESCGLLSDFGEQFAEKWGLSQKRIENEDIWEDWQDVMQQAEVSVGLLHFEGNNWCGGVIKKIRD